MRKGIVLAAAALLAACTPFGVWLYEEPTVRLEEVLLDTSSGPSALPPYVILAVKNRNDFELSLRQVELVLRIDGRDVGRIELDTVVTLAPIATRPVRIMVPPADDRARSRIAGLRNGSHRYAVAGRARVDTPIGERRIGFEHEIRGGESAAVPSNGGDSLARSD